MDGATTIRCQIRQKRQQVETLRQMGVPSLARVMEVAHYIQVKMISIISITLTQPQVGAKRDPNSLLPEGHKEIQLGGESDTGERR